MTSLPSTQTKPSLHIGPLVISPPLALAPISGRTHSVFRRMIQSLGGCGLVVTEMIQATAFSPRALRSHRILDFHPEEHPIAVQIVGRDPTALTQAAVTAQERGLDVVDINAGCPAPMITGKGWGAALLRDLDHLEAILRSVRGAITIPLTLKLRSGWNDHSIVATEVARLAEDCGCDSITLHPRTRAQRYAGRANWNLIHKVVESVQIPVFASGDIHSIRQARRCFQETGCAGLMIARGVMANPWLISQVAATMAGATPHRPTPTDRYHFLRRYRDLLQQEMPADRIVLKHLKRTLSRMQTGLPGKAAFRHRVMQSKELPEAWKIIAEYFLTPPGD